MGALALKLFRILGRSALMGWAMFSAPVCQAGAWPVPKNKGLRITSLLSVGADRGFDRDGKALNDVDYRKNEMSQYWEHGITDTISFSLNSRLQSVNVSNHVVDGEMQASSLRHSGVGQTELALRKKIFENQHIIISAQSAILLSHQGEGIADADFGLGGTQFEARLLVGHGYNWRGHDGFWEVQSALRGGKSDGQREFHFDATAGIRPSKRIQIIAQSFYAKANEVEILSVRSTKRLKIQASLVWDQNERTSYQIGTYRTVLGRNIVREKAVFIGIWRRY